MQKFSCILLVLSVFLSCENPKAGTEIEDPVKLRTQTQKRDTVVNKEEPEENDSIPKEVVRINKTTKVKSVLMILNGEKHGLCKQFYPTGEIWKESMYSENKLHGKSKIYYETGKPKRAVDYYKGVKNGKFMEYYKSGNLKTEITYEYDLPMPDFTEINYRKQKVKQAQIKVRHEDQLFNSMYNLYFSFDGNYSKAQFFVLKNKEDWNANFHYSAYELREDTNKEFKWEKNLPKGSYYADELFVFGVYTTKNNNKVVIYKKVNLAISND